MTPLELFQEARLTDALEMQRAIVSAHPEDIAERLLLCDFLAFSGQIADLRQHLTFLVRVPEELREYLDEWRQLLAADEVRQFGKPPEFYIEPSASIRQRLRARSYLSGELVEQALDTLDGADELAPHVEGHVDGREFEGWRDSDDFLGPVIEVFQDDRYVWIPVEQIRKLRLEDADSLRDTLYRPATLWLIDGSQREVFVPTLYEGSAFHLDEGIRTGAGVDWIEVAGVMRGVGERTFLFGEEELGISEFKQVEIRRS